MSLCQLLSMDPDGDHAEQKAGHKAPIAPAVVAHITTAGCLHLLHTLSNLERQ